jgi:serine phosphatase RsbU (regulator of sigma subunit)/ligand-binding sensor domain-containing protein
MDFTNVWKVHRISDGVFYQSEEKLFHLKDGKIKVISPGTSFHTSFKVDDRLFVRARGRGLLEWKGSDLIMLNDSRLFDTTGIFFMLPYGKDGKDILIGTQEKGLWILKSESGSGQFIKFIVEDEEFLRKSVITGATLTGDGSIAIGTMLNGVLILDTAGKTKAIINTSNGLNDNNVKDILLDKSKNLWVALNNGISMIAISSPLSVFNDKAGITGSINALIRFDRSLYAGTTDGLFVAEQEGIYATIFRQVSGISSPVRSLVDAGGSLIAGSDAGLYLVSGISAASVDSYESYTLFYYPEMKLLFSGGRQGLRVYGKEDRFRKQGSIIMGDEDILGITNVKVNKGYPAEFWIGTWYNGAIRLKVGNDLALTSESYKLSDGLPDGPVIPYPKGGGVIFGTIQGLYSFTDEETVKLSLPDSLKNNKDFARGYFSASGAGLNGNHVSFFAEGKEKTWICSDNNIGYFDLNDSLNFIKRPFSGIDAGKINFIFPEESGICWIGATEGLIRYDENILKEYDQDYPALLRNVKLADSDSSVFMGSGLDKMNILSPLEYRHNSVRFDYSASFYEYPGSNLYSYKLDGWNSKWSQWNKENYQEFTNLREGEYTFMVKSRNIFGTESSPAKYSFAILPPWYRSVPAFVLYAVIFIVLLWLTARLYSYRLKRENIRLEGIITDRTAEIVKQKDEIVEKNIVLEQQKKEIEDSIRYAKRIQSVVIPSEKACHEILPETFVFFRPLNIVSGDFYWISRVEGKIIFTAADCTGHGVPGAFMSMLGVAFLNEIVNKDKIISPDLILNNLREKVIKALQQQGLSGETRDGMDIALVCLDTETGKLEYAGAYNPLVLIRKGEVFETPGEKMPIGFHENMRSFTKHEIYIERGDVFYMYSDGYEDQFGGPEGKKFKSKKLKKLFLEICSLPMDQQKEILERNYLEWKGEMQQIDDVVIVGLALR